MAGLALLFPGQASQAVGMGVALRAHSARAAERLAWADQATGLPIAALCEQGPLDRLTETQVAQPAVVAVSLAALSVLREELGEALTPLAVAGHSVGQLAAYAAAGVVDEPACLRLVAARAEAMQTACDAANGTMAAVLGIDADRLAEVCQRASDGSGSVEVANINAPDQLVISGEREAVRRAGELAREAGARRVIPLNVGGPFHSVYMRPAAAAIERAAAAETFQAPACVVVGNVGAEPLETPEALRHEMSVQVYAPVRWVDSLRFMQRLGCDRFLEVGPGQVLAGLVKRTLPEARIASFGSPDQLDAVRALLAHTA